MIGAVLNHSRCPGADTRQQLAGQQRLARSTGGRLIEGTLVTILQHREQLNVYDAWPQDAHHIAGNRAGEIEWAAVS